MQVKKNADVYLDRFFLMITEKEIVNKELMPSGVHLAEVRSSPGNARLVHRFGTTIRQVPQCIIIFGVENKDSRHWSQVLISRRKL